MRAGMHSASKTGSGSGTGSELSGSANAGSALVPLSGAWTVPTTAGATAVGTREIGRAAGAVRAGAALDAGTGAAGLLLRTIKNTCGAAGAPWVPPPVEVVVPLTGAAVCDLVPLPPVPVAIFTAGAAALKVVAARSATTRLARGEPRPVTRS